MFVPISVKAWAYHLVAHGLPSSLQRTLSDGGKLQASRSSYWLIYSEAPSPSVEYTYTYIYITIYITA